jgi:transaldolase
MILRTEPKERSIMVSIALDSPLLRMVRATPTQYWNDSCAVEELTYAVERGATGATSNPSIVLEVLKKESSHWVPRVHELAAANPDWSEVDLTWAIVEEMAAAAPPSWSRPSIEPTGSPAGCRSRRTRPTIATPPGWWSRRSGSTPWPRTCR